MSLADAYGVDLEASFDRTMNSLNSYLTDLTDTP